MNISPALNTRGTGVRTNFTDLSNFVPNKRAYRNGVRIYTDSGWLGNGFGNEVTKVAVLNDEIVAIYESARTHTVAVVAGHVGSLFPDFIFSAGRRYTSKTTLSKWTEAVKAL